MYVHQVVFIFKKIIFQLELYVKINSKIKLHKEFFYLTSGNLRGGIFMFSNVVFVTLYMQEKNLFIISRYGAQKRRN